MVIDDLVEVVRHRGRGYSMNDSDVAYGEIESRMRTRLSQISFKFYIPGCNYEDIYQESLFALRYKAIKDYDKSRSKKGKLQPFEKFALLCIRRHLSTKLKSSYQNKKKALNSSISLDQDRNMSEGDDILFLSDILTSSNETVLDQMEHKEYYRMLFSSLLEKLSSFEKEVFGLYSQKYSYEEIAKIIKKNKGRRSKVNIKSVDNALSRIKAKGKDVFQKHKSNYPEE